MADKAHAGEMKTVYTIGDAIPFKPLNPKAPQSECVLSGDMKTGPFRAIAKIPGGLKLPVHTHPASYAAVTLSGLWQKVARATWVKATSGPPQVQPSIRMLASAKSLASFLRWKVPLA